MQQPRHRHTIRADAPYTRAASETATSRSPHSEGRRCLLGTAGVRGTLPLARQRSRRGDRQIGREARNRSMRAPVQAQRSRPARRARSRRSNADQLRQADVPVARSLVAPIAAGRVGRVTGASGCERAGLAARSAVARRRAAVEQLRLRGRAEERKSVTPGTTSTHLFRHIFP